MDVLWLVRFQSYLLKFYAMKHILIAAALYMFLTSAPRDTTPDGECHFEGAECPNAQYYLRDYQLEYHNDTLRIYDADRLVGTHVDTTTHFGNFIDSTIVIDNL